jgi:beta-lactamase regulating signal transducer with metallopeptidase domain
VSERHEILHNGQVVVIDVTRPAAPPLASTEAATAPALASAAITRPTDTHDLPVWPTVLSILWLAGALVAITRQVMAASRFASQISDRSEVLEDQVLEPFFLLCQRTGINRKIRLTASANINSPVALGRGEICLPQKAVETLTPKQIASVLAHELAHLERGDTFWFAGATAIESLLFFQPLNSLARRQLQVSSEYLCDDWAAHHSGGGEHLATSLAEVATWTEATPQPTPMPSMIDADSPLVDRVTRLIENTHDRLRVEPMPWRVSAVLGPLALLALCAPRVAAADTTPTAPPLAIEPVMAAPAQQDVLENMTPETPAPALTEAIVQTKRDGDHVLLTLRDGTTLRVHVGRATPTPAPPAPPVRIERPERPKRPAPLVSPFAPRSPTIHFYSAPDPFSMFFDGAIYLLEREMINTLDELMSAREHEEATRARARARAPHAPCCARQPQTPARYVVPL